MSVTVKDSKTVGRSIPVVCCICNRVTQHKVLAAVEYSWTHDEDNGIFGGGDAQIIQCQGCQGISFREERNCSEDMENTELLYPERIDPALTNGPYLRDDLYDVPNIIRTVYKETLSAVQKGLLTLAGVGIRAVIEATCQDLKAKKGNLEKKIDKLVQMSLLTLAGASILHSIRLLGNNAAHDMRAPTTKQIMAALKVVDHLLLGVYVLPQQALVLPKHTPKPTALPVPKGAAVSPTPGSGTT